MTSLGALFDPQKMENARTEFLNDMNSTGFAAWLDICANTINAENSFDKEKTELYIRDRKLERNIGIAGERVAEAAVEIASICRLADNLSVSANPHWQNLLKQIKTELPDNLKFDILSQILLAWRLDIHLPDRVELTGECLGAVIDIEDNNRGDILKISMSLMKDGSGLFYPDPHAAYLKINTDDFREALDNVARACGLVCWDIQAEQPQEAETELDFDIRWSLLRPEDREHYFDPRGIGGPSLGGAMYTLCRALMMDAGKWPSLETEEPQAEEA